jgi:hypothetical protein
VSNFLAIAAVTTTLESILFNSITADADLNDTTVTTLPLDKARGNNSNNQLNLFLYHVTRNSAWSNRDIPQFVKPGETGVPPLPLNLYYLITAFGRDNDSAQPFGHELLGKAMITLHDHAILSPAEIRAATAATLPLSDLDRQIERVRITFQPLSLDELSKLWTGFSAQLRLSVAYEVAVALIESTQAPRTPLPALTRGKSDQGVRSVANLVPPFPAVESIGFPNGQTSARLGDELAINGHDLDGSDVGVSFMHPLWNAPIEIKVPAGPNATATTVRVTIPNNAADWPAGIYTAQVLVERPGDSFRRSTGEFPFALAPSFTIAPASAPAGAITYIVTATPEVLPQQRVSLLVGSGPVNADPHPAKTATLTFDAVVDIPGDYFVRLRVDGVDSLLVDKSAKPPVFDPAQKVTAT